MSWQLPLMILRLAFLPWEISSASRVQGQHTQFYAKITRKAGWECAERKGSNSENEAHYHASVSSFIIHERIFLLVVILPMSKTFAHNKSPKVANWLGRKKLLKAPSSFRELVWVYRPLVRPPPRLEYIVPSTILTLISNQDHSPCHNTRPSWC